MSNVFKQMQSRQIQKRANNFINSLKGKDETYVEHAYLDNKEFENNEIVLSYLFFNHPNLIKMLPIDFQVSRVNSNLNMFNYASDAVKKKVVSEWLKGNKFFMNANVVQFDEEEFNNYLKLYFKQPEDVAKLYMDDLRRVIKILDETDIKETENVINTIKDKLTDKQWNFILEVNPRYIKYASQTVQNAHAEDEKFIEYINGNAKQTYIDKQVDKIKEDISLLPTMSVDTQRAYIEKYPYMINYLDEQTLIDLLKYDIELIKYVNMPALKNGTDKTFEMVYSLLDNVENKSIRDVIDLFVSKCILTAKGKLYRYDSSSNNMSYQYTKRGLKLIQSLSLNQIAALINIDVNYCMPYIIPIYNTDTDREIKERCTMDANSRCLKLFRYYYGDEIYEKYYKVINKIYCEYIQNIDKYDYEKDYNCLFEIFKVLFNKEIISKNNVQKVTIFIGMSLIYKTSKSENPRQTTIKLLNELINTAYGINIVLDRELYEINSLEIFDKRFNFIDKKLLSDFESYNFVNMSSLLLLIKSTKAKDYFEKYYELVTKIYDTNKETLYRCVESFPYYYEIIKEVDTVELSNDERKNILNLFVSFGNFPNMNHRNELLGYDLIIMKQLVEELSAVKDITVYKNVLANHLFNKGYDEKGNFGWLEVSNIKELIDIFEIDSLQDANAGGKKLFSDGEVACFAMMKLLFETDDLEIILSFIENVISSKSHRNLVPFAKLFTKLKKYKVEIINNQIVTIRDIELLYIDRPQVVSKKEQDGVTIYTIKNQDFKIICSENNDGSHYICTNVTKLDKNVYGYNKLLKSGSIRFTIEDNSTNIRVNKDNKTKNIGKPDFIVVVKEVTSDIIANAKKNNLSIIEIRS